MIYNNILDTIGNTPVVKINKIAPSHVNMYVKIEAFNPMSSVKDRLALGIINDALKKGDLKPGQTVVEATSGNTGIALAMVCAVKDHPFVAVMSETFSIERRKLMKALGAKVILTPAAARGTGMVEKALELSIQNGWFLPRQFENPANPNYHSNTTAAEILSDFRNIELDYFVSGYGTGGTISGVGEVLKLTRPGVKIIGTEPDVAQLVGKDQWQPHKIQGWIPDFVPVNLNRKIIDQIIPVSEQESRDTALELAQKEGVFCGVSAGGTFAAALHIAKNAHEGATILAMLPDTGERYLSTYLFEDITEGSD